MRTTTLSSVVAALADGDVVRAAGDRRCSMRSRRREAALGEYAPTDTILTLATLTPAAGHTLAPTVGPYEAAAHGVAAEEPAGQNVPVGHDVQTLALTRANRPAAQTTGADALAGQ